VLKSLVETLDAEDSHKLKESLISFAYLACLALTAVG
jgi:hypothetical protein